MMIIWLIYHTQSKKYFLKRIFQEINFMGQRADALQPKREDNAVQSFLDYRPTRASKTLRIYNTCFVLVNNIF